jgi:hypothetical protein
MTSQRLAPLSIGFFDGRLAEEVGGFRNDYADRVELDNALG